VTTETTTETGGSAEARSEKPRKRKGPERGNRCLNCGVEPLASRFCPDCGQENINYAVTLPVLLRDVTDEFLKFDGRLFRTLGALLLSPGKFTVEYNAGRRVHYLSPFKLYLVVSALFFYVMALYTPTREIERNFQRGMAEGTREGLVKVDLATDRSGFAIHTGGSSSKAASFGKEKEKPRSRSEISRLPAINGERLLPEGYTFEGQPLRPGNYADAYEAWQDDPKNPRKHKGLRRFVARQVLRFMDHPGALVRQYIEGLAKAMFFMVPLYALPLAVLFRGSRRFYVEHLIFALNQHTVAFLFGIVVVLVRKDTPLPLLLYFLVYWLYEFLSLRRVYRQRPGLTLFKQFVLNNIYTGAVLVAMFVVIIIAVALL
jgi:ribosomal protein L32